MSSVTLTEVVTRSDLRSFLRLPNRLYARDPTWVAPLELQLRETLSPKKNPFFLHARAKHWVAWQNGIPVGRISASWDPNYNSLHASKTGFFGYFESVNAPSVARALLDQAETWLRDQGATEVVGPVNLSTNNECGLLIEGFDRSPSVMTTHHLPYYAGLIEAGGYVKAKDLYAYWLDKSIDFSPRLRAMAERVALKEGLTFRSLDMSRYEEEIETVFSIYNDAWEKNWGFVPMTRAELTRLAYELKPVVDPRLVLFVEVRGEPAAFSVSLPDINIVLKKLPQGRLFPTGIFKLLWGLKGPGRKNLKTCRIVTLGVRKRFESLGLGPLLYTHCFTEFPKYGYEAGEASWILEDNLPMNKALLRMGAVRDKVYRLYSKLLTN